MRDDDLTALLQSPALSLDPPPDLLSSVHQGARRVRRRRAAGVAAGLSLAAALVGTVVLPGLGGAPDRAPDRVAAALAERFPNATTSVELLERLNGGDVVTFFEGTRWCTGAARTLVNDGCRGYVGPGELAPFALYLLPGDPSLTVDRDSLTAGVLGTGVARVEVQLDDGALLRAAALSGQGFPRPVWWAAVPPGRQVATATAYDDADQVVDVLEVRYDASSSPQASPRSSSE